MPGEYAFELELAVRDYECDAQGIVNNAVYQHYLEHARHEFLKSRGLDALEFARQGVNLVVARIELDYLTPLRGGDRVAVRLSCESVSRLRLGFRQSIVRIGDGRPVLRAWVIVTGFNRAGRPCLPPELAHRLC